MYGIRVADKASGLLVPAWDFDVKCTFSFLVDLVLGHIKVETLTFSLDSSVKARHLLSSNLHLNRITRILKSLTLLSPNSSSSLSQLHHVPSLILFLIAQHNAGRLDLSPGTRAGHELEVRWSLCIRNKALREAIGELVLTRSGTPPLVTDREKIRWSPEDYEAWVVSKARTELDLEAVRAEMREADQEEILLDPGELGMVARAEKVERERAEAERVRLEKEEEEERRRKEDELKRENEPGI